MKNLIEFILIHIVSHPEDVQVEEVTDEGGSFFSITVHPEDVGRVIGKNGSVIHALRTICKIRAVKEGSRVRLTIANE
jgi:uncharacterized protein